ncbi:transmembrane protein 163 isoform X1 [Dipodomys merriami]|uniref:transmembrane protein 163 isoform X1 n=1 Tax=Dipodomys merriami TaxID=94247 RepID=UPI00384D64F1
METATGSERGSPPGPAVPPPRGHAPLAAASCPGGLSPPAREPPQPEEERQPRISESGQFSDGLEDRGLLESSTRLKPHEAQNYRKKALWVSWLSIIVTLALAVAAFTVSVMRYSASAFGFAFDAILDVLSSAIVLWRYSNAAAVHSAHREYIACVILGVIFLLSSICIVVKAIHDLSTKLLPEVDDFLFSVSILSGILCSILAVLKFMLGKVLTSRALITDDSSSTWCRGSGRRVTTRCLSEGGWRGGSRWLLLKTDKVTPGFPVGRRCQYLTEHPISFFWKFSFIHLSLNDEVCSVGRSFPYPHCCPCQTQ